MQRWWKEKGRGMGKKLSQIEDTWNWEEKVTVSFEISALCYLFNLETFIEMIGWARNQWETNRILPRYQIFKKKRPCWFLLLHPTLPHHPLPALVSLMLSCTTTVYCIISGTSNQMSCPEMKATSMFSCHLTQLPPASHTRRHLGLCPSARACV